VASTNIEAADDALRRQAYLPAMVFALFDHLAVRQVHKVDGARPPAIAKTRPKLPTTVPPATPPPLPPWLQRRIGTDSISQLGVDEDGRYVAIASRVVALIRADHTVEGGLDLDGIHSDLSPEGTFANGFIPIDAHRVGDIVVVAVSDPFDDRTALRLVGIDATTGALLWMSDKGVTSDHFAILGGYVVTSVGQVLQLYAADTGKRAAFVKTTGGPYQLALVDGELRDISPQQ